MSKLSKMNVLINKLSDEPFKYGKADCFTFTNALVKEWHGKGYRHLHPYKSKSTAINYMETHGGIEALTTGTLGYPVATSQLENGDVVSAEISSGEVALGFVFRGYGYFKGHKQVMVAKLNKCRQGWKIK